MTATTAAPPTPPMPEERIARLEGAYPHLATKADIESVRVDIESVRVDLEKLAATVERQASILTWRMIIVAGVIQALGIGALLQFLPRP